MFREQKSNKSRLFSIFLVILKQQSIDQNRKIKEKKQKIYQIEGSALFLNHMLNSSIQIPPELSGIF